MRRSGKFVSVGVHIDEYVDARINIDDLLDDLSDDEFVEAAMKRQGKIKMEAKAIFGLYLEDMHSALLRGDCQEALCLFERCMEPAPKDEVLMARYRAAMAAAS